MKNAGPRATTCARGQAREIASGTCLVARDVRALAFEIGMTVLEDEDVVCAGDPDPASELVASTTDRDGPRRLGCLPKGALRAPTSAVRCPLGTVAVTTPAPACVRVADDRRVDVVRWLQLTFGIEGRGDGPPSATPFCEALAREPAALAASTNDVTAEIVLTIPNNDLSLVTAKTRPLVPSPLTGGSAGIAPAEAAVELDRAATPLVGALRNLAPRLASEATAATRVHCRRSSTRPIVETILVK